MFIHINFCVTSFSENHQVIIISSITITCFTIFLFQSFLAILGFRMMNVMCPVQVFNPVFGMNGTDNKLNAKPSFLLQLPNVRENIDIKFDPPTMCLFLMLSTYYMKP